MRMRQHSPELGLKQDTLARAHPFRPAHVHFRIAAPGHHTLVTHVFVSGDEYLGSDVVFGVKESLIVPLTRHEPGIAPTGQPVSTPYYTCSYDFKLVPKA